MKMVSPKFYALTAMLFFAVYGAADEQKDVNVNVNINANNSGFWYDSILLLKMEIQALKESNAQLRQILSADIDSLNVTIGENKLLIDENKQSVNENKNSLNDNKLSINGNTKSIKENKQSIEADLTQTTVDLKAIINNKVNNLKSDVTTNTQDIQENSEQVAACLVLGNNVCGSCKCHDDQTLEEKYYCDCRNLTPKRDCLAFRNAGNKINGIYRVTLQQASSIEVFCDQTTGSGGWTVIQRRLDGRINFYRDWLSYKEGFGELHREFWLGNEYNNLLTKDASILRIDMKDWARQGIYAKYSSVLFYDASQNYRIQVSGYSGTAGDSLNYHSNKQFSTFDEDNDTSDSNCAKARRGGWWYSNCAKSNLNGEYVWQDEATPGNANGRGVVWYTYKDTWTDSMKTVEMKVRRK